MTHGEAKVHLIQMKGQIQKKKLLKIHTCYNYGLRD